MNDYQGVYEHFKGGHYFVLRLAHAASGSDQDYVVYESLSTGEWFFREKNEFFEYPIVNKYVGLDGGYYTVRSDVQRFKKLY